MTGVAGVLAAALALYALVVEPLWGWWYMRRLRERVEDDDDARVDAYRLIVVTEWTLAGCALVAYALSDLRPYEVFLAWPRDTAEVPLLAAPGVVAGMVVGLLAGAVAAVFGLAHIYQGAAGVVITTMMGAVLGLLVVATGSLLPAVLLHAAADLRVLLLVPRTVAPVDR